MASKPEGPRAWVSQSKRRQQMQQAVAAGGSKQVAVASSQGTRRGRSCVLQIHHTKCHVISTGVFFLSFLYIKLGVEVAFKNRSAVMAFSSSSSFESASRAAAFTALTMTSTGFMHTLMACMTVHLKAAVFLAGFTADIVCGRKINGQAPLISVRVCLQYHNLDNTGGANDRL